MDFPGIGGPILCALCHFPMTVQRTYGTALRQAYCTNRGCHTQLIAGQVIQETSLYTAPHAGAPRPTL
jgi:hypothetical protein